MPVVVNAELQPFESRCPECGGRRVTQYDIKTDTTTTLLVDPEDDYCQDCIKASNSRFTKHVHEV